MDANKEYRRLFRRTYDGIRAKRREMMEAGNAEFARCRDELRKAFRPKGSRKKLENVEVPQEAIDELLAKLRPVWVEPYDAIGLARETAVKRNKERMFELADSVVVTPLEVYHRVRRAHASSWSSQGWGAETYARGELLPDMKMLQAEGLDPHISRVVTSKGFHPASCFSPRGGSAYEVVRFDLWVNCEPYVADAVSKRTTIEQACKFWKAECINPLVYNPFLPLSIAGF